jgi:membrane-associated phospholipid phosphatase
VAVEAHATRWRNDRVRESVYVTDATGGPVVPRRTRTVALSADPTLWALLLGLASFDAFAVWSFGWTVVWRSLFPLVWGVGALCSIAFYYRRSGRSEVLARFAETIALGLAIPTACEVATFVVGTIGAPFQDATLVQADAWFGFRWESWVAFLAWHPWLAGALAAIYATHLVQAGAVLGLLALRTERQASRLLRAFLITFAVCCVGLIVCPALGHILQSEAVPIRLALRDGTFHSLDFGRLRGIISMPSMHAALSVTLSLAAWPVRRSRWFLTPLSAAMVVATVGEGGHYLVDVMTGVALAFGAWRCVREA